MYWASSYMYMYLSNQSVQKQYHQVGSSYDNIRACQIYESYVAHNKTIPVAYLPLVMKPDEIIGLSGARVVCSFLMWQTKHNSTKQSIADLAPPPPSPTLIHPVQYVNKQRNCNTHVWRTCILANTTCLHCTCACPTTVHVQHSAFRSCLDPLGTEGWLGCGKRVIDGWTGFPTGMLLYSLKLLH